MHSCLQFDQKKINLQSLEIGIKPTTSTSRYIMAKHQGKVLSDTKGHRPPIFKTKLIMNDILCIRKPWRQPELLTRARHTATTMEATCLNTWLMPCASPARPSLSLQSKSSTAMGYSTRSNVLCVHCASGSYMSLRASSTASMTSNCCLLLAADSVVSLSLGTWSRLWGWWTGIQVVSIVGCFVELDDLSFVRTARIPLADLPQFIWSLMCNSS